MKKEFEKENAKLKAEIEELKTHCRAVDAVNVKMKNCVNCKYSEDYDYYRDRKCCICDSKYSKECRLRLNRLQKQ